MAFARSRLLARARRNSCKDSPKDSPYLAFYEAAASKKHRRRLRGPVFGRTEDFRGTAVCENRRRSMLRAHKLLYDERVTRVAIFCRTEGQTWEFVDLIFTRNEFGRGADGRDGDLCVSAGFHFYCEQMYMVIRCTYKQPIFMLVFTFILRADVQTWPGCR